MPAGQRGRQRDDPTPVEQEMSCGLVERIGKRIEILQQRAQRIEDGFPVLGLPAEIGDGASPSAVLQIVRQFDHGLFAFAAADPVGMPQAFRGVHGGMDSAPDDRHLEQTAQMVGQLGQAREVGRGAAHAHQAGAAAEVGDGSQGFGRIERVDGFARQGFDLFRQGQEDHAHGMAGLFQAGADLPEPVGDQAALGGYQDDDHPALPRPAADRVRWSR